MAQSKYLDDYVVSKDLHFISKDYGNEMLSVYPKDELKSALGSYNDTKTLMVIDIDGTIKTSPTMSIVTKTAFKPQRYYKNPEWLGHMLLTLPIAGWQGWSKERIETFSLEYAEANVIHKLKKNYPHVDLDEIAKTEAPPLFPNVKDVLTYFSKPKKLLVSRTFEEIVRATEQELNNGIQLVHDSYHRIDDKVELVLDKAEEGRYEKILIFGDLQNDIDPAIQARDLGYEVFMTRICKRMERKHYHPDVDLYIERNWTGLRDLLIN